MRKAVIAAVLGLVLGVSAYVSAAQKKATWEGTLVDSKCYLKNNALTGNDHGSMKDCGTICLRGGTPGALLTKDKKFYAILAPSTALAPYVGQQIRIEGALVSGSINPSQIEVNKDGKWEALKLGPTV